MNSGHVSEPTNQSYSVQTPALRLKIVEEQVSAYIMHWIYVNEYNIANIIIVLFDIPGCSLSRPDVQFGCICCR